MEVLPSPAAETYLRRACGDSSPLDGLVWAGVRLKRLFFDGVDAVISVGFEGLLSPARFMMECFSEKLRMIVKVVVADERHQTKDLCHRRYRLFVD